jgi:hypothetical protein
MMSLALTSGSTASTLRINARLDPTAAQRLDFLIAKTGMAVSDVVRTGIEHFYNATRKQQAQGKPTALAQMAGRYGSGQSDLSVNYKQYLLEVLDEKYPRNVKTNSVSNSAANTATNKAANAPVNTPAKSKRTA